MLTIIKERQVVMKMVNYGKEWGVKSKAREIPWFQFSVKLDFNVWEHIMFVKRKNLYPKCPFLVNISYRLKLFILRPQNDILSFFVIFLHYIKNHHEIHTNSVEKVLKIIRIVFKWESFLLYANDPKGDVQTDCHLNITIFIHNDLGSVYHYFF